ncbi:MAG TPA: undecaprenyl-diphosphatase UppP [Candidatus Nanoarchaeia archaeon]|nr:undecaprenyl-diphosphatase [uncultured archaeon]
MPIGNLSEIFQAAILGIIQGVTEFLPISSSGHLFLVTEILGWEGVVNSLSFDLALHVGTSAAVVLFFWRDFWRMIKAFVDNLPRGLKGVWGDEQSRLLIFIVVGSVPAGVIGFLFEDFFTTEARNLPLVALTLIFFGLLLYLGDRLGRKDRQIKGLTFLDSLFIGLAQSLALVPGVSRSGITITSGLFRNLDREASTRFSFLLSTPAILGASILKLPEITNSALGGSSQTFLFVGVLTAAVSGFLAIKVLLNFIMSNNFTIFVIYRVVLGLAVLAVAIGI